VELTILLLAIPLICIPAVILGSARQAKLIALVSTLVSLLVTILMACTFVLNSDFQFTVDWPWIKSLGIGFTAGVDGISLMMLLLTNVLMPVVVLSAFHRDIAKPKTYFALILLTQLAFVGVFMALDAFLFYIFWELSLVPMYFISLFWGKERRVPVTFKFFLYTLAGSLIMLVAFIYLYLQTPAPHSFSYEAFTNLALSQNEQSWIFWALFIGFAVKVPLFPVHGWLPDTHTEAPTQGTLLLAGVMLKMGLYGLIRWIIPIVPLGVEMWADWAIVLSIAGILYASSIAIVQTDLKRMIAFSSIGHLGLASAGIFALNLQGLQGGVLQAVNHGITSVGLFFVADVIYERLHTRNLPQLGGIAKSAQSLALLFMILMLGSVALPATNGFVGELLLMIGLYQYNVWFTAIAGLGIILSAVYMLRAFQKSMYGEANDLTAGFKDLIPSERIILVTLAAFVILIGIFPKPLLDVSEPAVQNILNNYNQYLLTH
jgi:NADH-quinone oxidoreductase subunit M